MKRLGLLCLTGLLGLSLWGQDPYHAGKYREALDQWRSAYLADSLAFAPRYNMACAYFQLGILDSAARMLTDIPEVPPQMQAAYHYNAGCIKLRQAQYSEAAEFFRQAILADPTDVEAKCNYIYARDKAKEQQDQNKQDQNQDQNNQDQNQDQNDQDQNKQDQNQDQNQNNQDQNKQDQSQDQNNQDQNQNNQNQPQPNRAQQEQMLRAVQAKEKQTQDKVRKAKALEAGSRQKEKNW